LRGTTVSLPAFVVAGLLLGFVNDYTFVRFGPKAAVFVIASVFVVVYACLFIGEIDQVCLVLLVVAFISTQYVARPLLNRCLGRS
jgi:hypothetical protein